MINENDNIATKKENERERTIQENNNKSQTGSLLFDKDDDLETIFQKCKISIETEPIQQNQKKIKDFFKPTTKNSKNMKWTKRDEVKYFGNDKRRKESDDEENNYYKK